MVPTDDFKKKNLRATLNYIYIYIYIYIYLYIYIYIYIYIYAALIYPSHCRPGIRGRRKSPYLNFSHANSSLFLQAKPFAGV